MICIEVGLVYLGKNPRLNIAGVDASLGELSGSKLDKNG